jgi:8-oxo-dGTP diphosphatase
VTGPASKNSKAESGKLKDEGSPLVGRVEVAAAVVIRDDGEFLLAQRPAGKVYAGYWEFPGGKVEPGESAVEALARELQEELGIHVERAYPWITRDYDYEHAAVRLRFFQVRSWRGEPHGRENQRFSWQAVCRQTVTPLLPANGPVLRALKLPTVYGISDVANLGEAEFMRRLERALQNGMRLLQLREPQLTGDNLLKIASRVVRLVHDYRARVVINGNFEVAGLSGADGVHLPSAQLMRTQARPAFDLVGASCHDAEELTQAVVIGADYAVLGPVLPTPSHPGRRGIGWKRLATLLENYPLPVYALGGLRVSDLDAAWQAGAHGVSLLRRAWEV